MKNVIFILRNLETDEPIGAVESIYPEQSMKMQSLVLLSWPTYFLIAGDKINIKDFIRFHNIHFGAVKIKDYPIHFMKVEINLN